MQHPQGHLLVDANVLIDYLGTDPSVLALASRYLGTVHVLSTVLDEVDGIDERGSELLGLEVFEPELTQLVEAAEKRSSLSTQDHLCLVVARARRWTCLTNDGALRRACAAVGVPVLWGLEVMAELEARSVPREGGCRHSAGDPRDQPPPHSGLTRRPFRKSRALHGGRAARGVTVNEREER